jgi:hypothetical protein
MFKLLQLTAEVTEKIHNVKYGADLKFSWRWPDVTAFSLVDGECAVSICREEVTLNPDD